MAWQFRSVNIKKTYNIHNSTNDSKENRFSKTEKHSEKFQKTRLLQRTDLYDICSSKTIQFFTRKHVTQERFFIAFKAPEQITRKWTFTYCYIYIYIATYKFIYSSLQKDPKHSLHRTDFGDIYSSKRYNCSGRFLGHLWFQKTQLFQKIQLLGQISVTVIVTKDTIQQWYL